MQRISLSLGRRSSGESTKQHQPFLPYLNWSYRNFICFSIIYFFSSFAQLNWAFPGDLDPTFGGPFGRYFLNLNADQLDSAGAIARQPDGKLIIGGTCGTGNSADFCILRRNADGSADTAFGYASGISRITLSLAADYATAAAVQTDGKIVVAGSCVAFNIRSFCMVRLLASGVFDTSFGSGGVVNQVVGAGNADPRGMVIQPDGKIVMGGTCFDGTYYTVCAARFLSSGAFDPSFGNQGRRFLSTTVNLAGYGLALQSDGAIIVAGSSSAGNVMCAYRFTANGAVDSGYGISGIACVPNSLAVSAAATSIALQADGKSVIAGYCVVDGPVVGNLTNGFCFARLDFAGALDSTFGSGGVVKTTLSSAFASANALAVQPDGRIIATGECSVSGRTNFCTIRLNDGGSVDTSFGTNGVVKTNVVDGQDVAYAVHVQPDGAIVVAGLCTESSAPIDGAMCIARYQGGPLGARQCSLDIDGDGVVLGTTDLLILNRVSRGMRLRDAINSIVFAAHATRKTWGELRTYLRTQCDMKIVE